MNSDRFEAMNFRNKMLIIISHSDNFSGNVAVLKTLTGGDGLKGRQKLVQGSYDFYYEGNTCVTSNFPMNIADTSGALERRIKVFGANNVVNIQDQKPLLYRHQNRWNGKLAPELPGILRWAQKIDLSEAISRVQNFRSDEEMGVFNPFKQWVEESLLPGEGSYVGFKTSLVFKPTGNERGRKTTTFISLLL